MESSKSGYWGLKNVTLLADLNVKLSDGKTMTGKAGSVAMNPKMVGIGESGLDFHYTPDSAPAQRAAPAAAAQQAGGGFDDFADDDIPF